jgi:sulfur-carrier protein
LAQFDGYIFTSSPRAGRGRDPRSGTAGFSRRYTGGAREFTVEARNLRGVIKAMDRLYPGLGERLEEETTVAIDGALHETAYFQPLRPGSEVSFISKLEGG